jgi:hypothetical protein
MLVGCVTNHPPPLAVEPEPPIYWDVSPRAEAGCPNIAGTYLIIPEVATFQDSGDWYASIGDRTDYILLLPFGRVESERREVLEPSAEFSSNSLIFVSNNEEVKLQIISPIKETGGFSVHTFISDNGDYMCESGHLEFPEFEIHGRTEGAFLSGRIYRRATKTVAGDLIFYEQTQGQKTVHKYYLFKQVKG